MYVYESWTIKKAEGWRIDAFEPWCWRRLLRIPWTARRSNQSILKEINPEHSLEGLMLKLKLQFGHPPQRTDLLEKTPMLRKIEGRRRGRRGWDGWMASLSQWTGLWAMSNGSWVHQELVNNREAGCATVNRVAKNWTWLNNWTKTNQQKHNVEITENKTFKESEETQRSVFSTLFQLYTACKILH